MFIYYKEKFLLIQDYLLKNIFKILINTTIMYFLLIFALDHFSSYLDYLYKFKSVYLLLIVGFVAVFYLISCYFTGILKVKNFKTN